MGDHKRKFAELGLNVDDLRLKRPRAEPEPEVEEEPDEDLLDLVDLEAPEIKALDSVELQTLTKKFEKTIRKNKQMRMKYSNQADKFMASELELDGALRDLEQLATAPELFGEFVNINGCKLLQELLVHENTDIVTTVINLIRELIEAITETADEAGAISEEAAELADQLVEDKAIQLIFQNLERLDSTNEDDKEAIHDVFAILEGISGVDPELCPSVVEQCNLFKHLLRRIKGNKKFDENKLYESEILAIYVQMGGAEARKQFAKADGIQKCLILLKQFYDPKNEKALKKRVPEAEEIEFIGNLMGAVESALNEPECRDVLTKDKPVNSLKVLSGIVRGGGYLREHAMRCLNMGLSNHSANCSKFVELGGLKCLFARFMSGTAKKRFKQEQDQHEELVMSMVTSLFLHCRDTDYLRLMQKFREQEFEKIDRLMELHGKYALKLERFDRKAKKANDPELQTYERRLSEGLFCLQLVDMIVGFIATAGDNDMKERAHQLLNQQDMDIDDVRKILREYRMNAGEDVEGQLPLKTILVNIIKAL